MIFELIHHYLEPGQILTALFAAMISIALRRGIWIFLEAFLSFLANLVAILFFFLLAISALLILIHLHA